MTRNLTLLVLLFFCVKGFSQKEVYRSEDGLEEVEVEFLSTDPNDIRKLAVSLDLGYNGGSLYLVNASYHEPAKYIIDGRFGFAFLPETSSSSGLGLGFDLSGTYLFRNERRASGVTQSLKTSPGVKYVFRKELDKHRSYGVNFGFRNAGLEVGRYTLTHQSVRVGLSRLGHRQLDMTMSSRYKRRRGQTFGRWNADVVMHFNHQFYDNDGTPVEEDAANLGYMLYYDSKIGAWTRNGRLYFNFMGGIMSTPTSISEVDIILSFGLGFRFL